MMNKSKTILALFLALYAFGACTKDPLAPSGQDNKIEVSSPVVTGVTQVSAILGTVVSSGESSQILDKGICYGTSINPLFSGTKRSGGAGTGNFSATLTGLFPGTTYYSRAYFQTSEELVYSENSSFRTLDYQLAGVSGATLNNLTSISATAMATVISLGGGAVSQRGFCWSTSPLPTIANSRTLSGSGLGSFSDDISPLLPGTTYYLRPYATNQAGTVYGTQLSLTTINLRLATVGALTISSIARTSASITGSVTADGGGAITSRGVCYSSSTSSPTITSATFINNGAGIGPVGGLISSFSSGVTYYVRAYAVNAAGVSYGTVSSFRTL